ncbi:thrombospondin type 3 repeat-containing protein [Patescibacteria group bacterium]
MSDDQGSVDTYIKQCRAAGMNDANIISQLVASGWSKDNAESAVTGSVSNVQQSSPRKKSPIIVIIVFVVLIAAAAVYWFVLRDSDNTIVKQDTEVNANTTTVVNQESSGDTTIPPFETIFYDHSIFGKPVEYFAFQEQIGRVDHITSALSFYYSVNDEYPDNLNTLLEKPPALDDLSSLYANRTVNYFRDEYHITSIPADLYTTEPFIYANNDTNYTLQYMVSNKPTERDEDGLMENYNDGSYYDSEDFLDGINIADLYFLSIEIEKNLDFDEDGLSNYEETEVYPTSSYDEDTDEDGINDYDEIQAGTDPNLNKFVAELLTILEDQGPYTGSEGSISFWARSDNWEPGGTLVAFYIDKKRGIGKQTIFTIETQYGDQVRYRFHDPDDSVGQSYTGYEEFIMAKEWHHIVLSWKVNETPKLFLNGGLLKLEYDFIDEVFMTDDAIDVLNTTFTVVLGGSLHYTEVERVTEVTDYSYTPSALTQTEVNAIFLQGPPGE